MLATTHCAPAQNHHLDVGVVGSRGLFGPGLRDNPVSSFSGNSGAAPATVSGEFLSTLVSLRSQDFGKAGQER